MGYILLFFFAVIECSTVFDEFGCIFSVNGLDLKYKILNCFLEHQKYKYQNLRYIILSRDVSL